MRRTLPLVARYADVWHAWGTPSSLAADNARVDELAAEAGRDNNAHTPGRKVWGDHPQATPPREVMPAFI